MIKKIYIAIFFSALIVVGSCRKAIDLNPTDEIPESIAIESVTDLEQATQGAYAVWIAENVIYTNTLMSDEARLSNENTGQGQFAYKWQHSADIAGNDLTAHWVSSYDLINRVNRALEAYDRVNAINANEQARKIQLRGELLALRAITHFDLIRMYATGYNPNDLGVPLVTRVIPVNQAQYPARSTVGEVMAQVDADLAEAKNLLPLNQPDIYRLSRIAVAATQARIALYMKNWTNAINYATEVINAVPLADRTTYPSIFRDESNAEVIFKLRRNVETLSPGDLWQRSSNGDVFFAVSNKLLQAIDANNDVRYSVLVRIDNTKPEPELVNKYPGSPGSIGIQDIKVYRTSEMYLIRAEAYTETNNPATAAADVNTLRTNRITGVSPLVFATKEESINAILKERFIELAYEGHRYFDLRRRGLPITRLASDLNNAPEAVELSPSNFRYILPIPQSEIFANPNIQQNPGY